MKKQIFLLFLLLSFVTANAQWKFKLVNNGFDEPYKIAYTDTDETFLKLEKVDSNVYFLVYAKYTCDYQPFIEMSFMVNGNWQKYTTTGVPIGDSKKLFSLSVIEKGSVLYNDFKKASHVRIRVTDLLCDDIYILDFNMTNSSAAIDFMLR